MRASVRPCTAGLAAASAGVITLSLICAPAPKIEFAAGRAEFQTAVHLVTVTTDVLTVTTDAVLASTASATSASAPLTRLPGHGTAAGMTATGHDLIYCIGGLCEAVYEFVTSAVFAVVAPIWYLAFPITFPLTKIVYPDEPGWAWLAAPINLSQEVGSQVTLAVLSVVSFLRSLVTPFTTPATVKSAASRVAISSVSTPSSFAGVRAPADAAHSARNRVRTELGQGKRTKTTHNAAATVRAAGSTMPPGKAKSGRK